MKPLDKPQKTPSTFMFILNPNPRPDAPRPGHCNSGQDKRATEMQRLQQATEYMKVLAHPLRLSIIRTLRCHPQLSVGQLAELCEVTQPMLSGHLRLLKDRGLLHKRRQGRQVYYHVSEPALARVIACFGNNTE